MTDKVKNWTADIKEAKVKPDKTYKNHMIKPKSMIMAIGATGSGKTNSLLDFIARRDESFYEIIIFTGANVDEPLFAELKRKMPDVKIIDTVADIPDLKSFDDDKEHEKLIVFDNWITLKPKEMIKINEYLTAGRHNGFTCFLMSQNYTNIPKIIMRNIHYIILFKLSDNASINNIIRNHNVNGIDKETFKNIYLDAVKEPFDFFMIDMRSRESHLRHNFLDVYNI